MATIFDLGEIHQTIMVSTIRLKHKGCVINIMSPTSITNMDIAYVKRYELAPKRHADIEGSGRLYDLGYMI